MKLILNFRNKKTIVLILVLWVSQFKGFSQSCDNPYISKFDGAPRAYITNGSANDPQNPVEWNSSSLWLQCGGNPSIPPYDAEANKTYIEISAGDYVYTEEPIKFGNSFTLVVCGHLELGTLAELDESSTVNGLNLIICPTGVLKVRTLDIKNVGSIQVNGLFIVDFLLGNSEQNNCIFSTSQPPGVIISSTGTAPFITPDGFSYGGGDGNNSQCTNQGAVVLPINLLSFTPSIKPDRVELNWTTGTEINNDYFTIERSRDLYGWEVLGFVQGAGNSSIPLDYGFSDFRPLDGLGYYRLKQTDFDGKFKYYGPIAAHYDLGLEGLDFKVMKQFTNWVIAVPNDGVYQVEVYNLQGHRLVNERTENTLTIPAPQGAVVIRVTDGFERSASRVVM